MWAGRRISVVEEEKQEYNLNVFRPLVDHGVDHMDTVDVYIGWGGDAEEAD